MAIRPAEGGVALIAYRCSRIGHWHLGAGKENIRGLPSPDAASGEGGPADQCGENCGQVDQTEHQRTSMNRRKSGQPGPP